MGISEIWEHGTRDLFGTADATDYKRLAVVYDGDICTYRQNDTCS